MVSGLGLARLAYSGNSMAEPLVDGIELRVEVGDNSAHRVRRLGIGYTDSRQQVLVLALTPGDQVLPITHNCDSGPAPLAKRTDICASASAAPGLQRPLRKLEAFFARLCLRRRRGGQPGRGAKGPGVACERRTGEAESLRRLQPRSAPDGAGRDGEAEGDPGDGGMQPRS